MQQLPVRPGDLCHSTFEKGSVSLSNLPIDRVYLRDRKNGAHGRGERIEALCVGAHTMLIEN